MNDQTIVVTILTVRIKPDDPRPPKATVTGDSGGYYYLPGADYSETVRALAEAGFKLGDRFWDAVNASAQGEPDS